MNAPYCAYQRTDTWPLLYVESIPDVGEQVELDAGNARHCLQVLRMEPGDRLLLTDGRGLKAEATLVEIRAGASSRRSGRKSSPPSAVVHLASVVPQPSPPEHILAVALPHHAGRAEWLMEKATELGIRHIYPLITVRSTYSRWKPERYHQLMIAAMLQSFQFYLPELHPPIAFAEWIHACPAERRAIAHCEPAAKLAVWQFVAQTGSKCILVGPEGDFTPEEIEMARKAGWQEISLGHTRLRTETAAIVACTWMTATVSAYHQAISSS
ncbi:MAG: 16S rRNA (uracil(1498)-N(3))-methyltransferase [Thermoflavifilum sp.]|uniref:RsmE family RNA methyltransferase n=1 Tax=Thermoflavifilum sp. TaxID=1968839 RepID=UPI0018A609B6|nr:RsmE family RNA methyltransferase [Thermoflavifilum sp.]QOR75022.1 MAG: 16S rRNA (uracil(1498)-N(3))-methyltransferase [Thermoflavifilum sp.]